MAIQVALNHKTTYHYDRLVALGPQIVRLRPAPHCRTPILSYSLRILPRQHFLNWQQDPQSITDIPQNVKSSKLKNKEKKKI